MLNIYKINYKKLLINRDLTKTIIKEGVDNYLLLIVSFDYIFHRKLQHNYN